MANQGFQVPMFVNNQMPLSFMLNDINNSTGSRGLCGHKYASTDWWLVIICLFDETE